MESLEEFKKATKKVDKPRNHKITKSWGVKNYFRYYRKNRPKDPKYRLEEGDYYKIIRRCNELIRDHIIQSDIVILPKNMGTLELIKRPTRITIEDGKLKNSMPYDWNATLNLWYEDEEAFKNKTLLRIPEREVFSVKYSRTTAYYKNSLFYDFSTNREFKLMLKDAIKEGNVESFTLF